MPRLVICPKCRSLLQEPPPGNPLYQCGNCSTTLQAKHAAPKDLEATNRRISAEQQRRRTSYSDSSSGEIGSDAVADEFPLTGNGDESPLYKKRQNVPETGVGENGSPRSKPVQGVTNPWRAHHQRTRAADPPYPQSLSYVERDVTQQRVLDGVSGTEHAQEEERAAPAEQEIGSRERDPWSSSHDAAASYDDEMSVAQRTEVRSSRTDDVTTTADELKTTTMTTSVGQQQHQQSYGTETATLASSESRTNGNSLAGELQQQLQEVEDEAHVQRAPHPDFSSLESGQQPDSGNNTNHAPPPRLKVLPSHEPIDDNNAQQRQTAPGNMATATARSSKLRWQGRESDSGDEALSSGAASSKGISEDDDGSSQDDLKLSSLSINETPATEQEVVRNLKTVQSRRRSLKPDRRSLDELQAAAEGQQQLLRAPSDESDRTTDMYDTSALVQDYEQSDNSSTTMDHDEVESNGAGGGSGQFSGELIDRQASPSLDPAGSSGSRSVPRLNLPRSTTNSSRGSALSEESSSYGSPSHIEVVSPENNPPINNARITAATRRHSWDERTLSRMGAAASGGYTGPQQGGALSVRMKSSSHDFGGGQRDYLTRMSSVSSDPGGRSPSSIGRSQLPASSFPYDNPRPPSPYALHPSQQPQPQQQWANRYVPPSQQQWSPNSPHRSYFPEPSPLHPLPSRLRQVPSGQLPPKQGHYPPLPPPGALPHVVCQHCGLLLAVPDNLPPNQKSTQKLRCGSCRKISIFSVPQAEGSNAAAQVYGSSRSDSLQNQPMLASSPDSQSQFSPAYRSSSDPAGQRSVRRYSVPDLADKQNQAPLARKHSLGNEDLGAADQEMMGERALSERAEALAINSAASSPSSMIPWSEFRSPSSQKSSPSGEIPYQKGGGAAHAGYNSIPRSIMSGAGESVSAEEKFSSDVALSDSESDSLHLRSLSATSSPQLNQSSSNSRSPNYPPLPDPKPPAAARAPEESANEARGLNVLINIFSRKGSRGSQYRRRVVVNGKSIPDNSVKKAEEQAGPIHPGTYWYDVQVGFWGVAGGPCLGIIPPFIEEFNHPMTRDCAAGRTNIYVNGRELHIMDREKLCRRGLPDTPGMSYQIEISGRVVEEASRSELRSLGRLAPSLEKSGRGAGMRVPSND